MRRTVVVLASCVWLVDTAFAQAPPAIEVASIRVHARGSPGRGVPQITGSRVALGGNLNQLIMYAWDLKSYQIHGGPDWVAHPDTDRDYYDVIAQAEGTEALTQARARQLIQSVLTERFGLMLRREKEEMPVYVLVPGRNEPKLAVNGGDVPCHSTASVTLTTVKSVFTNCNIDYLMRVLAGAADRPVVDETGLTGLYDFKVEFARSAGADSAASDAPSLFTAVQEQLGLKIETQKRTIEIFMIDRVERPSEN